MRSCPETPQAVLRPPSRRWIARFAQQHEVEMWAWWHPGAGRWEIDFDRAGNLRVADVEAAIAADEIMAHYEDDIAVATDAGAAVRWARAMREPGAAVILDTETTDLDGYVVELAVIDAATGDTLLNTLVNPGEPISDGARWVHGITDEQVADAPPWADVLPKLLDVTAGPPSWPTTRPLTKALSSSTATATAPTPPTSPTTAPGRAS